MRAPDLLDVAFVKKLARTFVFTRSASVKRYTNLAKIGWQHFVSRPDVVAGKPIRLVIDPSTHCNLRCPLCPTGQGRHDRQRAMMHFEDFARIIDEVGETLFEVDLFGWGEPLLNPELPRMIAYARAAGITTSVSSHLNTLREPRALIAAGLDRLIVSLDGASAETYARYRVGGDFDRVVANVAELRRLRGKRKTPRLIWQFLAMRHNEHEIAQAKDTFVTLGFDALDVRPVRTDMGKELAWSDAQRIAAARDFLPTDAHSRYDTHAMKRRRTPSTCLFLWTQAVIDPRGQVSPCCAIYDEREDVGSVAAASFLSVWNNPRYRDLRKRVRTRDMTTQSACGTCIKHGFIEY